MATTLDIVKQTLLTAIREKEAELAKLKASLAQLVNAQDDACGDIDECITGGGADAPTGAVHTKNGTANKTARPPAAVFQAAATKKIGGGAFRYKISGRDFAIAALMSHGPMKASALTELARRRGLNYSDSLMHQVLVPMRDEGLVRHDRGAQTWEATAKLRTQTKKTIARAQ